MKKTFTFGILIVSLFLLPALALAGNGNGNNGSGHGNNGNQGNGNHLKIDLIPSDVTQADLTTASGRIHEFLKNKGTSFLHVNVKIPTLAPSLGVSDAITAAALNMHIEFSRDTDNDNVADTILDDCALEFKGTSDELDQYKYRLKVRQKKNGTLVSQDGLCGGTALPDLAATDTARVYVVDGISLVQTNFMSDE